MADIFNFPTKPIVEDEQEQTSVGEAFCIGCSHEWVAVVPVPFVSDDINEGFLQCPNCLVHKGKYKFAFAPSVGQEVRQCDCGNQLFWLTREGHQCPNCGIYQQY